MSISQNFPEEGPTLNLNFAGSKTLDPRITFSRTTTGTYMDDSGLIKVAPADAPRFDHRYVNGEIESLGLLVEEERSNLFTRSEEITTAYFGGGGTIGTDTILNPYGISSSVSYVTTSERVRLFNADGYSTLAFSFFSKKRFGGLERDYAYIEIFQVAVGGGSLQAYYFNYDGNNSDGTYVKDVKTEQYPNGWYRFSCRLVARSDYNGGTFSTTSRVDIEGGYSDNYVWGIQVEAASFATSYMPTSGSTATRNPDNVSMTGDNFSDWYNQSEGSILWRGTIDSLPISGSRIFEVYNSSTDTERMAISVENDGTMYMRVRKTNDTATQTYGLGTVSYGSEYKISLGVDGSSLCLAVNDEIKTTISDSFILSSSDTLIFTDLRDLGGARKFTTRHTGLSYYPTRLTNAQLQTLTK